MAIRWTAGFRKQGIRRPGPRQHVAPARSLPWLLALALAGCGGGDPVQVPPRPVLVARADAAMAPAGGAPAMDAAATGTAFAGAAFAGEVRAREEATLSFRVGGNLVHRAVDVGDRVRRGDLLAELDPGDLRLQAETLQAQRAAADAQLLQARADHARLARLAGDQLVSRAALDQQTAALRAAEGQARAARAQWDVARNQAGYGQLRAPRDGVIASRQAEAGQVLAPGQPVFGLAVDGAREVVFALPESDIRAFAAGQPVVVELWSAQGQPIAGRIREIAPAADAQTRTYAARATLDAAASQRVDLGQSARVYVANGHAATMRLPLTALQRGEDGATVAWVIVPGAAGKPAIVRPVPIRVGAYAADGVAVLSGLKPGDWVVVAGAHLLHAGQPVAPVDRGNRPVATR